MRDVPILDPVTVYANEVPSGVQGDPWISGGHGGAWSSGGGRFPPRAPSFSGLGVFEIWEARPDRLIAMLSDPEGRFCFVESLALSRYNGGYAVHRLRVADALAQTQAGSLEDHLAAYDSGRFRHHVSDRLSGGILSPVIAFWNYMYGGGVPYRVAIEDVGIRVEPHNLTQLTYLRRPAVAPGRYRIDETIPFRPGPLTVPGSYLFGVKLHITGYFDVLGGGGGWTFSGSMTASDATYDLTLPENWGWLYDLPGNMFPRFKGRPYAIHIDGKMNLSFSGR